MNSKNIIIGILFLTTVGGGIYGWTQRQRANDLATKNIALNRDLQSAQRASQRRSSAQADDTATAQTGTDARASQRAQFQANFANMRNVMQSPAATKLMASQQRAMLDNRYAPLFKSLNLTPDQLAKFKDLLVDKQNAARDVMTVAREQGLTDRAEIQQLIQQAQADVDNNIAAAIGQDKLSQYQNYDHTAPQRAVVNQIAQSLSYTSDPLTPAQSDQLVALLAQNAPQDNTGGGQNRVFAVNIGGMGPMTFGQGGGVPITNQVINAAQSFLSPAQVDALRQMQAQQTDQQQLQQMFNNAGGGGGPGGPGSGGGGGRRPRGGRGGGNNSGN